MPHVTKDPKPTNVAPAAAATTAHPIAPYRSVLTLRSVAEIQEIQKVLELDPGNEEALDYIRDADRRSKPRSGEGAAAMPSVVGDARRLAVSQGEEAALELLQSAPADGSLESEAMVELLRANLYQRYQAAIGDLDCIPRASGDASLLQGRNLPPSAGFLLAMVDGKTPLADLMAVSGMDRFEALRAIHRMREAGIVEWSAR